MSILVWLGAVVYQCIYKKGAEGRSPMAPKMEKESSQHLNASVSHSDAEARVRVAAIARCWARPELEVVVVVG